MKALITLLVVILFTGYGCRKDVGKKPTSFPTIEINDNFICEDTALNWTKFYNPPANGYNYYSEKSKETVWRVVYDPNDKNVIYYTTNEGNNFHHLWRFNKSTNSKSLLDKNVSINLSISKNGWIAYEKQYKNIYIIKTNGDSLAKLTVKGEYMYPSWAEDCQSVYFWDENNPKGFVYRSNKKGEILDTIKQVYGSVYSIKNFIYYLKLTNNVFYLVQRNLTNGIEKDIVTRAVGNSLGESFQDFYTNEANTILYWWGGHGLSKTDLITLQTTRIVNGGYGSQNQIMQFRRSLINGRFLAIQFNETLIDSFTIRLMNKIIEFTEDGTCRRTIEIPD